MSDTWFIAWHDLKLALRARETWLWTFVMPPVFFYFTGLMGGSGARMMPRAESIVVEAPAAEQSGPVLQSLVRNLRKRDWTVQVKGPREGGSPRVLVVRDGFNASVLAGREKKVEFYQSGGGLGASFAEMRVKIAIYQTLADLAVASAKGAPVTPESLRAVSELPRPLQLQVETAGRRKFAPSGFEQSVPGTIVMFTLLVLLTSGAATLVIEREEGILRRLASSPLSRASIVGGKWLARMAIACIQVGFGMATGSLLFGVRWGGNLWAILLVLSAYAALVACAALLLGNWARSPGQAVALAVVSSNVLAAFGGCWWPIEIAPRWAQNAAFLTPTGWAMDAIHKLMSFGLPASAVWPHFLVLSLGALALGWATARKMRFE